jgi:hypothetical protein
MTASSVVVKSIESRVSTQRQHHQQLQSEPRILSDHARERVAADRSAVRREDQLESIADEKEHGDLSPIPVENNSASLASGA